MHRYLRHGAEADFIDRVLERFCQVCFVYLRPQPGVRGRDKVEMVDMFLLSQTC
jgi:hypothetical protein